MFQPHRLEAHFLTIYLKFVEALRVTSVLTSRKCDPTETEAEQIHSHPGKSPHPNKKEEMEKTNFSSQHDLSQHTGNTLTGYFVRYSSYLTYLISQSHGSTSVLSGLQTTAEVQTEHQIEKERWAKELWGCCAARSILYYTFSHTAISSVYRGRFEIEEGGAGLCINMFYWYQRRITRLLLVYRKA